MVYPPVVAVFYCPFIQSRHNGHSMDTMDTRATRAGPIEEGACAAGRAGPGRAEAGPKKSCKQPWVFGIFRQKNSKNHRFFAVFRNHAFEALLEGGFRCLEAHRIDNQGCLWPSSGSVSAPVFTGGRPGEVRCCPGGAWEKPIRGRFWLVGERHLGCHSLSL